MDICYVIKYFITKKCQNIKKLTKAVKIEEEINDLMNFNQVFGKNVAYDNLKVTKNHDFTVSLENIFWKNHRGKGE